MATPSSIGRGTGSVSRATRSRTSSPAATSPCVPGWRSRVEPGIYLVGNLRRAHRGHRGVWSRRPDRAQRSPARTLRRRRLRVATACGIIGRRSRPMRPAHVPRPNDQPSPAPDRRRSTSPTRGDRAETPMSRRHQGRSRRHAQGPDTGGRGIAGASSDAAGGPVVGRGSNAGQAPRPIETVATPPTRRHDASQSPLLATAPRSTTGLAQTTAPSPTTVLLSSMAVRRQPSRRATPASRRRTVRNGRPRRQPAARSASAAAGARLRSCGASSRAVRTYPCMSCAAASGSTATTTT